MSQNTNYPEKQTKKIAQAHDEPVTPVFHETASSKHRRINGTANLMKGVSLSRS